MNKHQKYLVEVYFDYVNNYVTLDVMAEAYGISVECLSVMLKEGAGLHYDSFLRGETRGA